MIRTLPNGRAGTAFAGESASAPVVPSGGRQQTTNRHESNAQPAGVPGRHTGDRTPAGGA
jgi:hypothetical protein